MSRNCIDCVVAGYPVRGCPACLRLQSDVEAQGAKALATMITEDQAEKLLTVVEKADGIGRLGNIDLVREVAKTSMAGNLLVMEMMSRLDRWWDSRDESGKVDPSQLPPQERRRYLNQQSATAHSQAMQRRRLAMEPM